MVQYKSIYIRKPSTMSEDAFQIKLKAFDEELMKKGGELSKIMEIEFDYDVDYDISEEEDEDPIVEHGTASWGDAGYFCHCGAKFTTQVSLQDHIAMANQPPKG